MTASCFRRKDINIIGDLPRNILESILERMPVRDAARTSILSSKWRYIWTTISQLVLDNQFFEETLKIKPIVQLELAKAVEKILLLHDGPIRKFVLCLPLMLFNGHSDIDHWILFLSRNGIQDFTLDNSTNTPYQIHTCIYSCRELTQLKLVNCILKLPRDFIGFQNVIELHFDRVTCGNNMLGTLLSKSILLQKLSIKLCRVVGHLNIHAPNLRVLSIINSAMDSLSFGDTTKLRIFRIVLYRNRPKFVRGDAPGLVSFLAALPTVSFLCLDSSVLEILAAGGGPCRLPTRSTNLNSLSLLMVEFCNLDVWSCTLLLMQSCPSLKRLDISFSQATNGFDSRVVNHLEALSCMDRRQLTLAKLLYVKTYCLKGLKPHLLLVKLLLACSPELETLFIGLHPQLDVNEGFKIAKELSEFPRLSPRAAVRW